MKYYNNILETIGNTPLVKLNKIVEGIDALVLAKVEYFNPGNSIKDRIGIKMIEDAEKNGLIKPGGTIIEGTSGNTGMGLALAAVVKGYKLICTMPDKQSKEKMDILRAVGAEVIVTPTNVEPDDPRSYYSVAKKLSEEIPNSWYPNQYQNLSNREAHYEQTGPEIWEQTDGKITHLVVGVGTGGTISGIGRYLKEKNPDVKIWGIDTYGSVFKKYHETKEFDVKEIYPYLIEGIGEDILPANVDFDIIDLFEKVTDKDAYIMTRKIAREEGMFCGNSAGAAIAGLLQLKDRFKKDDVVVVILPDHGSRYVGKAFNDDWMRDRGFLEDEKITAADIIRYKQSQKLTTITKNETIHEAIELMQTENISQMPVVEDGKIIGSISENSLYGKLLANPDYRHLSVENIMEKEFPVISPRESYNKIAEMLGKDSSAVLVENGNGYSIITKFDIINALSNK